ncbi:hypothetical protein FOZ63_031934 [Perkinsus olseni]|uniref:Uncharacterized protein n=1 Tax=Perkinsus olseni TaxID=32597 RepID=A0A7J6S1T9_PEROL|nr:hypothetical protein FOZ60_005826 [Perkinsus olseni]KAF4726496.1 hypothetical protein FOZ62_030608 [Perkinsus olseni]KAF4733089.1 hypothetical protein FOZ63_031934 [Perkinsus olseni]
MDGLDVTSPGHTVVNAAVKDGDHFLLYFARHRASKNPEFDIRATVVVGRPEESQAKRHRTVLGGFQVPQRTPTAAGSSGSGRVADTQMKFEEQRVNRERSAPSAAPEAKTNEPISKNLEAFVENLRSALGGSTPPEQDGPEKSLVDKFIGAVWIAMMEKKWGADASDGAQRSSSPPAWRNAGGCLGEIALIRFDMSMAARCFASAAELDGPQKVRSRLCCIVARCGGLVSTQPYEECPSAKELVCDMFDSQDGRFAGMVDAARGGDYSNFEARVKELLASRGESSLLPLVLKGLYVALGSGRQRWRGPARRICGHVVQAAGDDAGGRPFEAPLRALLRTLEQPESQGAPRSFAEFKDKVREILVLPPSSSTRECHVQCSRRCRRVFDACCDSLEPMLLPP